MHPSSVVTHDAVARAVDILVKATKSTSDSRAIFLTGAGISSSVLPDYRSPVTGLYNRGHKPITFQAFVATAYAQQRYWARSTFGYVKMARARPYVTHFSVAKLVRETTVFHHCVTQNVDGLLSAAMHERIPSFSDPTPPFLNKSDARAKPWLTELHGSIHYAVCMKCGAREHRADLQRRIEEVNSDWIRAVRRPESSNSEDEFTNKAKEQVKEQQEQHASARPDGDFFLTDEEIQGFKLPSCLRCGEQKLKPDVVLFGDNIDPDTKARAEQLSDCAALVCAGTSLQVPSAYRFVREMQKRSKPILIFNDGPTRLDEEKELKSLLRPDLITKVTGRLEQSLRMLAMLLPRS